MKKYLAPSIILTIFLFSLAGVSFTLLQSTILWQWLAVKGLEQQYNSVTVTLSEVNLNWQKPSIFKDIHAEFKGVDKKYDLSINNIVIKSVNKVFQENLLQVEVEGFDYKDGFLSIEGLKSSLEFYGKNNFFDKLRGNFLAKIIGGAGVLCTQAKGNINARAIVSGKSEVLIDNLKLLCYGGGIQGQLILYQSEPSAFSLDLNVTDIDLKQLGKDLKFLSGQVAGQLSGTIKISKEKGAPAAIEAELSAPNGGFVKAVLLESLMAYLPSNSRQYQQLRKMIADGRMVPLDKVNITVNSVSTNQVRFSFDLLSIQLNIKPNVTLDINLDTEFHRLLEVLE